MRAPKPISVIIACPHCGTRYQVPPDTLGSAGRKVACAHCGQSWLAEPKSAQAVPEPDDKLFSDEDERALDKSFAAEEEALKDVPAAVRQMIPKGEVPPPEVMRSISEIKAALEGKPGKKSDGAAADKPETPAQKKAQSKLEKRQRAIANALPSLRLGQALRVAGIGLLVAALAGGVLFRTQIVRVAPDLAGLYAAVGLKVNVVGLDFSEVTTLLSRRGGTNVLTVDATILGVEPRRLIVPPVVVTLLGEHDQEVYAWSVAPKQRDLEPGEVISFSAELASPPEGAKEVRLSFADGSRPATPVAAANGEAAADHGSSGSAEAGHGQTEEQGAAAGHGATTEHNVTSGHEVTTEHAGSSH
jgi:predicted Zn finger-like uncharacterized protein